MLGVIREDDVDLQSLRMPPRASKNSQKLGIGDFTNFGS